MFGRYGTEVGAEVLYYGDGDQALVAESGQDWDAVLLVRYPTRRAFSEMVRNPAYHEGTHLRDDALVEAALQPTVARPLPSSSTRRRPGPPRHPRRAPGHRPFEGVVPRAMSRSTLLTADDGGETGCDR